MAETYTDKVRELMQAQLADWKQAADNYEALAHVSVKELEVGGFTVKVQFNSARIVSSAAKVDSKSISERKCFLCGNNRPEVQNGVPFKGESGNYTILVNPFPIFPRHLTVPDNLHVRQTISGRFGDMLSLAESLPEYVLFYNGPKCGASAPDHMHFQAGNKGFMPVEYRFASLAGKSLYRTDDSEVLVLEGFPGPALAIVSAKKEEADVLFGKVYDRLPVKDDGYEPMLNILAWYNDGKYFSVLFPRKSHRPSCYFDEGDENILISPASVDMGGVFITPLEKDFVKLTAMDVQGILDEVLMDKDDFNKLICNIEWTK